MLFILYFLWIVFNGKITFEILWIGALVSGAIYLFCYKFLGFSPKRELFFLKKSFLLLRYAGLLIIEILKANIAVIKLLFGNKKPKPVLMHFNPHFNSDASKVLLSHSITLTPGTITVEIVEGEFWVHCLDESFADGIDNSAFICLLRKMEESEKND